MNPPTNDLVFFFCFFFSVPTVHSRLKRFLYKLNEDPLSAINRIPFIQSVHIPPIELLIDFRMIRLPSFGI